MKHAHVDETLLHGAHGAESASALGAHAANRGLGGSPCSRASPIPFVERMTPFLMRDPDPEPLEQPTRLACLVTETSAGVAVEEVDLLPVLRRIGRRWRQLREFVDQRVQPVAAE